MVHHAYEQSAYYRSAFDTAGVRPEQVRTVADLPRLPVLTRLGAARRASEIVATNASRFHPTPAWTSGTTGARLEFLHDRAAVNVGNAVLWRFFAWHGARRGHRVANVGNSLVFRSEAGEWDYDRVRYHDLRNNMLHLSLLGFDPQRRARVAEELVGYQPDYIRAGSPTLLTFLGLYLLDHPGIRIRPRAVFIGGERLLPDQREAIGEAFGCPVVEVYGNWEYAVFGGECEHGRLHLATEMGVVEILRNGQPGPPGEPGELTITNLWNRAFPFVRYQIGDIGYVDSQRCTCGRVLPTGRIVGGRERDLLATPQGYLYIPNSIVATPRWRRKIEGIRFVQDSPGAVVVHVVRGAEYLPADEPVLRDELRSAVRNLLEISIEYQESLEATPGGKYRLVVSQIPPGSDGPVTAGPPSAD